MTRFLVAAALFGMVALAGGGATRAQASASPPANCVATLTSYFGPQGQVAADVHTLQMLAAQSGRPFGQVAAMLAAQHGTVDQCLADLGLPPV